MKIVLICGSVGIKSHTRALLKHIEDLLKDKAVETVMWDLRERKMDFVMPEFHSNPIETPSAITKEFVSLIESCDGLVIGSPLYHGSYSGVLKNALDNLGGDALRNKSVALVAHGASARNAIKACEHLRGVVRTMYGYALQTEIGTGPEDYEDNGLDFVVKSEDIKARLVRLANELVNLTRILKENPPNNKQ